MSRPPNISEQVSTHSLYLEGRGRCPEAGALVPCSPCCLYLSQPPPHPSRPPPPANTLPVYRALLLCFPDPTCLPKLRAGLTYSRWPFLAMPAHSNSSFPGPSMARPVFIYTIQHITHSCLILLTGCLGLCVPSVWPDQRLPLGRAHFLHLLIYGCLPLLTCLTWRSAPALQSRCLSSSSLRSTSSYNKVPPGQDRQ